MPYYTDGPIGADAGLADLAPSLGMSVGAAVDDAFTSNPSKVIYDYSNFSSANQGPKLDKAEAEGRVKDAGVGLKIPDSGYSEDALNLLIDRKRDEIARQSILARAPSGVVPSTARFAASLMTGVLDPLNVASAFVPVVGEARYAEMLAGASGALGRAGVRGAVGAAEGAAGAALVEPINYFGRTQMQDDYHMSDSLLNLAMGAGLGGVLHVGGGAVGDKLGTSDFAHAEQTRRADLAQQAQLRVEAGKPDEPISLAGLSAKQTEAIDRVHEEMGTGKYEPGSAAAQAAEMTPEGRDASMRVAVAQAMEGRIPDVETISAADRQANLREFMAGSKVVDEQGSPKVMYHGTGNDIASFDPSRPGPHTEMGATFLTEEPVVASHYADVGGKFGEKAPNVLPVYVRAVNPFDYENPVHRAAVVDRVMKTAETYTMGDGREALVLDGKKTLYSADVLDAGLGREGNWELIERKVVQDAIKAEGHDSFYVNEGNFKNLGVYDPRQIKSAIGNSGRFDGTSSSLTDPISQARATAERQAAPESIAVADFNASRAADERIAAEPKTDPAQALLDSTTEKLDALLKNLEQRGMDPKRLEAMRAELAPFDEALADSKKLGNAMKAAAICGIQ